MVRASLVYLLAAGLQVQGGLIPNKLTARYNGAGDVVIAHNDALNVYEESLGQYADAASKLDLAASSYSEILSSASAQGFAAAITPRAIFDIVRRQDSCPPPTTVYQAPPVVTVVAGDPSSIASSFSYAAGIDSIVNQNSVEDRPTGGLPETTPIFYTHTASGPAIIGTDDPNDGQTIYHFSATTLGPVATTVVSFPAADAPRQPPVAASSTPAAQQEGHTSTKTEYTFLSTVTVFVPPNTTEPATMSSNLSITAAPNLQKRQTCSMIFAQINGEWASWCNNWDGSEVVSYSTYQTTTVVISAIGGSPVPSSVYDPSGTLTGPTSTSIPTSLPQAPSSVEPSPASTVSSSPAETQSSGTQPQSITTSIVVSSTVVLTAPVTTITQTRSDQSSSITADNSAPSSASSATKSAASPSNTVCGQVGMFKVDFDDLPSYNTNNPNDPSIPPIFSPYSHFYFTTGFGYGPPPNEPYSPHDGTRLAMWKPSDAAAIPATIQGADQAGSFGAGPRAGNSTFWFDAKSMYLGCNTTQACTVRATGYRWVRNDPNNPNNGHEEVAYAQDISLPALCADPPCQLTQAFLDPGRFSGLSTLNLQGHVGDTVVGYFFDTFEASWTNSTCAAGRERATSRK